MLQDAQSQGTQRGTPTVEAPDGCGVGAALRAERRSRHDGSTPAARRETRRGGLPTTEGSEPSHQPAAQPDATSPAGRRAAVAAAAEASVETLFAGELLTTLYDYNDVLIRAVPPEGHSFSEVAFDERPVYLQLNGKPSLPQLMNPENRLWLYGNLGTWNSFHLGPSCEPNGGNRSDLDTSKLYASNGEAMREVRLVRARPATGTPDGGSELVQHL